MDSPTHSCGIDKLQAALRVLGIELGSVMDHSAVPAETAACERFERTWQERGRAEIDHYLPPTSDPHHFGTLQALVRTEIKLSWKEWSDRQRISADTDSELEPEPRSVDDYCCRYQQLTSPDVLRNLIDYEIAVRLEYDDMVDPADYFYCFPTLLRSEHEKLGRSRYQSLDRNAPEESNGCNGRTRMVPPERIGSYRILAELGTGGMGVVYRARRQRQEDDVALKTIRPDKLCSGCERDRQRVVRQFHLEASATSQLQHPQIASVREVGEADGVPYYAMRCVQGKTLARVAEDEPVTQTDLANLIELTADAVQYAHDAGVLHCDLKPQNIIRDNATGLPVVTDFGLATLVDRASESQLPVNHLGTPGYMAPEQYRRGGTVSVSSDVYALGATLHHLLTGRPPSSRSTLGRVIQRTLGSDSSETTLRLTVDPDLAQICRKCLAWEPDQRFASAAELSSELQRWREQ